MLARGTGFVGHLNSSDTGTVTSKCGCGGATESWSTEAQTADVIASGGGALTVGSIE